MEQQGFMVSFISSLTASGVLTAVIIWLARNWISERLKASIQHEYNQKLDVSRAQLKADGDVALAQLKASFEKEAALHRALQESFAFGQKAAVERRLDAVDRIWKAVLNLRSKVPLVMQFVEVLSPEKYKESRKYPGFKLMTGVLSDTTFVELTADKDGLIERARPYIGEYLWAQYSSYQALVLYIFFLIHLSNDECALLEWHKSNGLRQLLEATIGVEGMKTFEETKLGRFSLVQRILEERLLASMHKIISGEEFGAEALEQARLIEERVASVKRDMDKQKLTQ